MSIGLPSLPIGVAHPPMDADALTWAKAVAANGGTVSVRTLNAVSAFAIAAKKNGYWAKLNRINLICGDQLASALVPLKVGGGAAVDASSFVSGDYTEATGLTGDGISKNLDTGLIPSVSLTLNSTHLMMYNRASSGNGIMGVRGGANDFALYAPFGGILYSDQYDQTGGRVSAAVGTPYGMLLGSRTAANAHAVYRNGASIASNTTSGAALPAGFSVFVDAFNNNGAANPFGGAVIGAYSIGAGLSAAEAAFYYTDMQAFQVAMGRGV